MEERAARVRRGGGVRAEAGEQAENTERPRWCGSLRKLGGLDGVWESKEVTFIVVVFLFLRDFQQAS